MNQTTTVTKKSTSQVDNKNKPYLVVFQFMDFVLFLIEGILLLDFILLLANANRGTLFFQLIDGIADVLMVPFRYIFPASSAGGTVISWSILVAMLVYSLVFYAIRKGIGVIYTADNG